MRTNAVYVLMACVGVAVVLTVVMIAGHSDEVGDQIRARLDNMTKQFKEIGAQLSPLAEDRVGNPQELANAAQQPPQQNEQPEQPQQPQQPEQPQQPQQPVQQPQLQGPMAATGVLHPERIIHWKNTTDLFQMQWLPYYGRIYKTQFDNKCWPIQEFKHNYTAPMLTCAQDMPNYTDTQVAAMTRKQLYIRCEGGRAFAEYKVVPLRTTFPTMGDTPDSRACLHHYINQFCYDQYPIPNVVHWVYIGNMSFTEIYSMMAFYSVHKILKPCLLVIHGAPTLTKGYWDVTAPAGPDTIYVPMAAPQKTTMGLKIERIENKADIMRLHILKEFGGMYMDTDEVIIKPVDIFRAVAMSVFHEGNSRDMTNAVMFARKGHPFLDTWIKDFDNYNGWAFKALSINYITPRSKGGQGIPDDYIQEMGALMSHFGWWPNDRTRFYWSQCSVFDAFGQHIYHRGWPFTIKWSQMKYENTTNSRIARYVFMNNAEPCQ